jgi:hypothetical protein
VTTRYTPRESFWRGHWAAIDGIAIATENDDADAFARGAERGAAALAEAMRCRTYRERWAWIAAYCDGFAAGGAWSSSAYVDGCRTDDLMHEESDR